MLLFLTTPCLLDSDIYEASVVRELPREVTRPLSDLPVPEDKGKSGKGRMSPRAECHQGVTLQWSEVRGLPGGSDTDSDQTVIC